MKYSWIFDSLLLELLFLDFLKLLILNISYILLLLERVFTFICLLFNSSIIAKDKNVIISKLELFLLLILESFIATLKESSFFL